MVFRSLNRIFADMNRLHLILAILCCMLLCACGHRYDARLIAIDSIIEDHADSAQVLLEAFDTSDASTANRMYHRLLLAKVSDHLNQLDATTEEAEQLVTYFEDDGDEHLLPIAYYYGGRICAEADNVPQALDYFHKAELLLTAKDDNPALLSKVYSQMGYLFVYRNMFEEARACSQKSYELDKAIRDTIGMIYNLRDIGISYKWADQEKDALPYFYEAKQLANETQDVFMQTSISLQLSGTYLDINELDSAKKYGLPLFNTIAQTDSSAVLSLVCEIYYKVNNLDSAAYYSQLLLKHGRKDAQCYAHKILTEVSLLNNNTQNALQHYREHQELKYQIDKANSTEEIAQANSAYNYHKKESENYELRIKNGRKEKMLLLLIVATIVLVLVFFLFFNRYRHRQATKLKELERIKNDLFQQSEEYRQQSRQRIAELEVQLQVAGTANDNLRQQLENEKGKLEASLEMAILKERESKQSLQIIRDSNVYGRILRLTNEGSPQTISDDDWQELATVINQECDGFTQRLYGLCGKMSELEYRVCLLIKADTDLNKVAEILIKAQPTISTTRSRLYQKAFGKKGSAKDWDAVIKAL